MKLLRTMAEHFMQLIDRYPRFVVAGAILILALLVIMVGPSIGLSTVETFGLTLVVFLGLTVFLLVERLREDRQSTRLERSIQKQALDQIIRVRPDRQAQIEAIRTQFEKAIAALKQSKLGQGFRGRNALYALPWYLLIGPPASGKSTALLNSGLQFPVLGDTGKGVRGVGGTRNCDWWFANEAVFLDTAGRYMTEEEDREEWSDFLGLVNQYRRKHPINGVLIMVSLPDLVEAKDEELEWHAVNIRSRLDEISQRLGLVIPVYLVFTKCDLLRGFVECFETLERSERDMVWGATFPLGYSNESASGLFEKEFQVLADSLQARRNATLLTALGSEKVQQIFSFPMQLRWARKNLTRFVELLFQPSTYQDNPLFRGFYLTSATQQGVPFDKVVREVSRRAGVAETIAEPFGATTERRSYFIRNLFADVIFPDQPLTGLSAAKERRLRLVRLWLVAGFSTLSVLVLAMAINSFFNNAQIGKALLTSAESATRATSVDVRQNVVALAPFREQMDVLFAYERQGPPLSHRVGMYRGATLFQPSKDLYVATFNRLYLNQTQQAIEKHLWGFVKDPLSASQERDDDFYYSLLKTYVMLSEPSHLDQAFLSTWFQNIWKDILVAKYGPEGVTLEIIQNLEKEIDLYTRSLDQRKEPLIHRDEAMVDKTRATLQKLPPDARLYARVREASRSLDPYTLENATQGKKQGVLVSTYKVPGLFTLQGWQGSYDTITERIVDTSYREAWVLNLPDKPREEIESEIKRRYFDDYIHHWLKFLDSVKIQLGGTLREKTSRIEALAQKETSPLVALLEAADDNTQLRSKGETLFYQTTGKQIPGRKSNRVATSFDSLHRFVSVSGKETQEPTLQQYLQELVKLRETLSGMEEREAGAQPTKAITDQVKKVASFVRDLDKEVQTLLLKPFRGVFDYELQRLNESWKVKVYEVYGPILNGKYPFRKALAQAEDLPTTKLAEFFGPQGIFWTFYEDNLKAGIKEEGDEWKVTSAGGVGMPVSPAFLETLKSAKRIRDALFQPNSAEPRVFFDLKPHPVPGVSSMSLVVDSGPGMQYANGPEIYYSFQWPSPSEETAGAVLEIQAGTDRQHLKLYRKQFSGRWGVFKLLEDAQVVKLKPSEYRVTWRFPVEGGAPIEIRMDLRASGPKDPFAPGFFTNFRLPAELG